MSTALLEVAFGVDADVDADTPYVVGVGAVAFGVGAITPGLPADVRENDILVLFLETNNEAITVAGWTQAANSPQSETTDTTRLTVFWKRATASETAPTTSDSGDHQIGRIVNVRGCYAIGDPWDVTAGGTETVSDTSGSIPGATTTGPNRLVLAAATINRSSTSTTNFDTWTNANLTGLTEWIDNCTVTGLGGGVGMAAGTKATAGNYGSTAVTYATASRKALWSGALKPAWVDVSPYLRSFDTNRGRQKDLDRIEAGTMTVVLGNADRRFDPEHASGPYFPFVRPFVQIRLSIDGTYLFRGYVALNGWQPSYPLKGKDSIVTVTCVDGFTILANTQLSKSVWEAEVRTFTGKTWIRLGDPVRTKSPLIISDTGATAVAAGSPQFGQDGLLVGTDDTGVSFISTDIISVKGGSPTTPDWTIEFLFRRPATDAIPIQNDGDTCIWIHDGNGLNATDYILIAFAASQNGKIAASVNIGGTLYATGAVGTNLFDNNTHHIRFRRVSNSNIKLFVDGIEMASVACAVTTANPMPVMFIGNLDSNLKSAFRGTMQEVIVWSSDIDTSNVHASWALTPFQSLDTGDAIGIVLQSVSWPSSLTDLDVGESTLEAHALGGSTLEYIQRLVETEEGVFLIEADGKATFYSREALVTAPKNASVATFGDGGGSELPYADINIGQTDILNEARVGREGGTEIVASDATSTKRYLTNTFKRSGLLHETDEDVRQHAAWIVATNKDPKTEIKSLVITPPRSAALTTQALTGKIGDLVTVKRRPVDSQGAPVGTVITKTARIEAVSHSGVRDLSTWRTGYQLSAWDAATMQPGLWDDAVLGVWDSSLWGF